MSFKNIALTVFLACISIATSPARANTDLPDLGDPSAIILSAEEDQRLGQAFMRSLRRQVDIIEDPDINAQINAMGYRLLSGADSNLPFNFFVVNAPEINAFAGPGGNIGIHSGLILTAESEGELAAVLAHEISHVTQRHLARAFQKASRANLQTAAAILAAIILGSHDSQLAHAAIAASTAGQIQKQLNFTRQHEREADRVGIGILARTGYDPKHMAGFFQRLQEAQRYNESQVPEILRTHPVTPARIADASNRAAQIPHHGDNVNPDFELIKAKLRIISGDHQTHQLEKLEVAINSKQSPPDTAKVYEYALIQLKKGNFKLATKHANTLLTKSPENPWFIALSSQIDIALNKPATAEKRLFEALKLYPNHPSLTMLYVDTLLQQNEPVLAIENIRSLIQQQGQFALPQYHRLLAKAETKNGTLSEAYQALAEYHYLIGQTRLAIEHLETALKHTNKNDSFNKERINSRLNVLKAEALEQQQLN